jgi:hypothetical protein
MLPMNRVVVIAVTAVAGELRQLLRSRCYRGEMF